MTRLFLIVILLAAAGCQPPAERIPEIPAGHPAQDFYRFVSSNPVSDKVCRDHQGDPLIPMGKVADGEGYAKGRDLVAGAFYFTDTATGKKYLGVTYLQYQGFLQVPKLCSWEEKTADSV